MTHPLTPREKVKLKPCPFCGGETISTHSQDMTEGPAYFWHKCETCGAETEGDYGEAEAASMWNRRTALASGFGDHAELARLAEAATDGPWYSAGGYLTVRDPDGSFSSTIYHLDEMGQRGPDLPFQAVPFARSADAAFIAAANPATVLALLAEIAALRSANAEAERKLDEAVRIFNQIEEHHGNECIPDNEIQAAIRTFLSGASPF